MTDFSLYTVRPYFHAKVFATPDGVDMTAEPDLPEKLQIIFKGVSDPHGAAVYLTREAVRSPWSSDERFTNVAYDIFIFHHNAEANLFFICSSRRHAQLYTRLAARFVPGRPRQLSNSSINRVLNDLQAAEFFSVGMRKRNKLGRIESYRMIAGPSADRAIQETDGRLYDRGHCFGKALEAGNQITIGVSTASKVWSNTYDRIPELLEWCNALAAKIASGRNPRTGSRLDLLSAGQELVNVPAGVIAMAWAAEVYLDPPPVFFRREDGTVVELNLLDFDLEIIESREGNVSFALTNPEITWYGEFSLGDGDLFQPASDNEPEIAIHRSNEDVWIAEYLNEESRAFTAPISPQSKDGAIIPCLIISSHLVTMHSKRLIGMRREWILPEKSCQAKMADPFSIGCRIVSWRLMRQWSSVMTVRAKWRISSQFTKQMPDRA